MKSVMHTAASEFIPADIVLELQNLSKKILNLNFIFIYLKAAL